MGIFGDVIYFYLESADGFAFKVKREAGKFSSSLLVLLYNQEGRIQDPYKHRISLTCLNGATLKKVVEYLTFCLEREEMDEKGVDDSVIRAFEADWKDKFLNEPEFVLKHLSQAARYMCIPELIADLVERDVYHW